MLSNDTIKTTIFTQMNPKISILIPVFNAEKWLKETMESTQKQTFKDWEVIAIDDFSKDNSWEILQGFAKKDERISVYQNDRKGIIPALQLALSKSNGEFITRFDADDKMPPNRLQEFYDFIQGTEKTIVTGKVEYFSEKKVSDGYQRYQNWLNERVEKQDFFEHIYRECVVASPNWLVRKSDLIEHNIFEELQYPEDYDMVFQWFSKEFSIVGLPQTTLHWREHPARTSRNSKIYDQEKFFELKLNWWKKLNGKKYKSIAVLGAGVKGKLVCQHLKNFDLSLYDLNFSNYNQPIEGIEVQNYEKLQGDCLFISIYPEKREKLIEFIESKGFVIGENAWWV